ncbi:hypothetical protein GON26_00610 [Flavobacterium sp. GA093]|uniref:Lipoprotein n=1 Tax=Flavobacterium hydrocarbonoxydans TaxID=2683249 RepID=A0A6I4NP34_9FLAO|nr:hypothetical protein [Flavobacterium hydrocarbonoxydans]MWB92857.1 hypothetical protein [Flavobacterium hydrocarbonoxydans]
MKYGILIFAVLLFSCGNKEEVLLPKASVSIVKEVQDLSPIYIFFKVNGKDTIAEVNRKNSIISTNWIFNIDKRLPLRLVIPEVMKLQEKKRAEKAHKNEKAENYYSYADSIGNNLAFLPFTKVYYKMDKTTDEGFVFHFRKGNDIVLLNEKIEVKKSEVLKYFYQIDFAVNPEIVFIFDENMSYEEYIQNRILVHDLDTFNDEIPSEFIF